MTNRQKLAQQWELVLIRAYRQSSVNRWKAPVARRAVVTAADDIRRLVGLLCGTQPVSPAGLEMAHRLLTDGTGPLYAVGNGGDLGAAVRDAVRQLDPWLSAESPAQRRS